MNASRYSAIDRFQLSAVTAVAGLVMASPARRDFFPQFTMTVRAVRELSPVLRRITFHAGEFADFELTGVDESFGLLVPQPGRELVMPDVRRVNVRQALRRLPDADRPDLRWYTIRAARPADAEIDVDFVLHGDAGPGTRWASAAAPGDVVGFRAGTATFCPPAGAESSLLVADETALPALSAILEAGGTGHVFVELPDERYRGPLDSEVPITWLYRGTDPPGSHVLPAVRDAKLSTVDYAWLCGESGIATGLRRHLVRERGVDRRRVLFSGYWRLGQARW
jgi:NADPH-dependent ferric siderophore reductase